MSTIELNPILVREVRARWRKKPAFAVVFGFATVLALAVWWRYVDNVAGNATAGVDYARGAALGRELFVTVSITQVAGWMLLAPLLTATGLMHERELGLLEAVQLSELTARQIINGKLLSMLAFAGLMLIAPLPVVALCFLLGGVSPEEFLAVALITFMTVVTSGLIGLNCAAWNHERSKVFGMTLGGLVAWATVPCGFIGHPMAMLLLVSAGDWPPLSYGVSMVFYTATTVLIWRQAVQGLTRPLWVQSGAPRHELRWGEPLESLGHATPPVPKPDTPAQQVDVRPRRQLPLVARLRFQDPILSFEVRRLLHVRWLSTLGGDTDMPSGAVLVLVGLYASPMLVLLYLDYSVALYYCLAWGGVAVALVAAGVWASESFARERELHTWEALLLTPLSRREIIAGKLKSVLFTCLYYCVPLIVGLMGCVRSVSFYHSPAGARDEILSLPQIVGAIVIAASAVWCYTAFAMLISWLCKRTWIATAWTVVVPVVVLCVSGVSAGMVNPWVALANLHDAPRLHEAVLQVAWFAGTALALGGTFLAVLYWLMGRAPGTLRNSA